MTTLNCGCVRGRFLCPEAERIWTEYNNLWHLALRCEDRNSAEYSKCWAAVEQTRAAYDAHFGEDALTNPDNS
jgi:hypothetical protein